MHVHGRSHGRDWLSIKNGTFTEMPEACWEVVTEMAVQLKWRQSSKKLCEPCISDMPTQACGVCTSSAVHVKNCGALTPGLSPVLENPVAGGEELAIPSPCKLHITEPCLCITGADTFWHLPNGQLSQQLPLLVKIKITRDVNITNVLASVPQYM